VLRRSRRKVVVVATLVVAIGIGAFFLARLWIDSTQSNQPVDPLRGSGFPILPEVARPEKNGGSEGPGITIWKKTLAEQTQAAVTIDDW
jgi:hypothetical protein